MNPLPKNQVTKRWGIGSPLASAVPFEFSMASSMGRPTVVAAPPARRPRRTARRLRANRFMAGLLFLFRHAHIGERGAGHDLDDGLLELVSGALEGALDGEDRGALPLRLLVPHRLPEEVLHDAGRRPNVIVHELAELLRVGEGAEVQDFAARIEREAVLVLRPVLADAVVRLHRITEWVHERVTGQAVVSRLVV